MARVQPKATPNWCSQVKPDEPWTGRCVKEKIADATQARFYQGNPGNIRTVFREISTFF